MRTTPPGRRPGSGCRPAARAWACLGAAWRVLGVLATSAAAVAAVPGAQAGTDAAADDGRVSGLIVRLHDSQPHARRAWQPDEVQRESARWRRLFDESGLGERAGRRPPALRPVGRDQQFLTFEQPLTAGQARVLAARLAARPEVAWVEPSRRERRLQVPDDPYFAGQWWLAPVGGADGNVLADRRRGVPGFQTAWTRTTGVPSAVIAVLDTGSTAHPDLAGRLLPGYDFVADSVFAADGDGRDADTTDPGDGVSAADLTDPRFRGCTVTNSSWHGTVIAGIAAAATNNGEGAAGISWNGRVLPVRVAGKCGADVADIVEGMRWAAGLPACRIDNGAGQCLEWAPTNPTPARVVNISFGSANACGPAYQAAVDELKAAGVVVVAAAGNEHTVPTRPANCRDVVGVVGLARDGYKTHYSNFGGGLAATGIATVSGDDGADTAARWNNLADEGILSIGNFGNGRITAPDFAPGYFYFWGTSFASPIVSGTVALMLGVNPGLTWTQIVDGLRRSARPHVTSPFIGDCSDANPGRCACTKATCGAGILDAEQAVAYALAPAAYVAPNWPVVRIESADIAQVAALFAQDRIGNSPPPVVPPAAGGGGGGLVSIGWLLALLVAATGLRRSTAVGAAHGATGGR